MDVFVAAWRAAAGLNSGGNGKGGGGGSARLRAALWSVCRWHVVAAAGLYAVQSAATLMTPVAINWLLTWVESEAGSRGGNGSAAGQGTVYVAVLAAAAVVSTTTEFLSEHLSHAAGLRCRTVLTSAVARAHLAAPVVRGQGVSSGEVVSLFSVDAATLTSFWHGVVTLLVQPIEILGNVGLLFLYVQWAAFGGIGVVVAAIAITNLCGHFAEVAGARRATITDRRLRDTYEMLLGMKVVKMNGWERRFQSVIEGARAAESGVTRLMGRYHAIINVTASNSVDVISLAVVVVYTVAMSQPLTPAVTFTYWVLLGLLHARIFHYPSSLKSVKEGLTAMARLQAFLTTLPVPTDSELAAVTMPTPPTVTPHPSTKTGDGAATSPSTPPPAIELLDASLAWSTSIHADSPGACPRTASSGPHCHQQGQVGDHSVVSHITLSIAPGEMVGIMGPVGSGKSTLLLGLAGEAAVVGGTMTIQDGGSGVGYVGQSSWIGAGTARDNITFGLPFDAQWYAAVVEACCLAPDFAQWPGGDSADVAQCTVSGGQRQRLGLARAVYARKSIYLLDDCLSALDQRVARTIADTCLAGVLAGSTRIVVSNTMNVLRHCDRVVLLLPPHVTHMDGDGTDGAAVDSSVPSTPSSLVAVPTPTSNGGDGRSLLASPPQSPGVSRRGMIAPPTAPPGGEAVRWVVGTLDSLQAHPDAHVRTVVHRLLASAAAQAGGSVDDVVGHGGAEVPPAATSTVTAVASPTPAASPPPPSLDADIGVSVRSVVLQDGEALSISTTSTMPTHSSLPFLWNWVFVSGGWPYVACIVLFLALEAACVEAGVYWLAFWTDDPSFAQFSFRTYMVVYAVFVAGELLSAFIRQHFYVCGTLVGADRLHHALLFRLVHAPMSFFDGCTPGQLITWFSRDLAHIDADAFYSSEYFWVGTAYASLIVVVQLTISAWVLIPFAIVAAMLLAALRRSTVGTTGANGPPPVPGWTASTAPPLPAITLPITVVPPPSAQAPTTGRRTAGACSAALARPMGSLLADEAALRTPLMSHLDDVLQGGVVMRTLRRQADVIAHMDMLLQRHAAGLQALADGQSGQVLMAGIIGGVYYIGTVALIVPLALGYGGSMTAGQAGFIVVNSCFASSMLGLVLEHYGKLLGLRATVAGLLKAVVGTPSEASVVDDAAACTTAAALESRYGPYHAAMVRGTCMQRAVAPLVPVTSMLSRVAAANAARGEVASRHPGWPTAGGITITNASLRYGRGPLVLKSLSLALPPGTHAGVIGRTGSGKSSLLTALIRLEELTAGQIEVDGVDVATLPIATLRGGITVISQDPLFFSASLRRNLDPFGEFEDGDLLDILDHVGLLPFATQQAEVLNRQGLKGGDPPLTPLDVPILERGANLSLGQQQLLAAARAWLRHPRILLMDESSAALDPQSEALLQSTLRTNFAASTVVQVAHRLSSIITNHVVFVLEAGVCVERGHPYLLLQAASGMEAGAVDPSTLTKPDSVSPQVHAAMVDRAVIRGHLRSMVAAMPPSNQAALAAAAAAAYAHDAATIVAAWTAWEEASSMAMPLA